MMKFLKKVFVVLVVLVLSIAALLWAFTWVVKPEQIQQVVSKQLTAITGEPSHIHGEMNWQFFPRPGLKVTDITIGRKENHSPYIVSIQSLLFNLHITPLMKGKFVFSNLKVDGFDISLDLDKKQYPQKPNRDRPNLQPSKAPSSPAKRSAEFAIDSLLLSDGVIRIHSEGTTLNFEGLKIGANQINLDNRKFPIQLKAQLNAQANKNKLSTLVNFKGTAQLANNLFEHPDAILDKINLDGKIALVDVKANQITFDKMDANASLKNNALTLAPLNMTLYKGDSVGKLNFEFASKKLIFNQTATNLDAANLFQDILGSDVLQGKMDLSFHVKANFSQRHWQETLQTRGSATLKDGVFNSIDIPKLIDDIAHQIQSLRQQKRFGKEDIQALLELNPAQYQGGTPFQLLNIQYDMAGIHAINDTLLLQTKQLNLTGKGHINLQDNSIYNRLSVTLNTNDKGFNQIQAILGGSFPLILTGPLTKPLVFPDIKGITPELLQYFLKLKLQKPIKHLKKELQSELNHLLSQ